MFYLVFLGEATGVLMVVFGDCINVWGLVDLELLFDVHLIPVYGPNNITKNKLHQHIIHYT